MQKQKLIDELLRNERFLDTDFTNWGDRDRFAVADDGFVLGNGGEEQSDV